MKRIVFVTNNHKNYENARRYLDEKKISVYQHPNYDLLSDTEDLQDFVASKAKAAFQVVQEPCFVIESYFAIEALNGFPGSYTKYVFETIGIDGILRLMEGISQRRCTYRHCLGYYDGTEMHFFFDEESGTLATKKAGNGEANLLNRIFIPDDFQTGLEDHFHYRPKCIEQFAQYLNTHTSSLIDNPYNTQL